MRFVLAIWRVIERQSENGKNRVQMTENGNLYQDDCFSFRFADGRIIPRFHLEGIRAGRRVSVFKIEPCTGERLGLLTIATVGEGGWVDLIEPIIVRAGEAFVVVPEREE
jgi:hypothetical protein